MILIGLGILGLIRHLISDSEPKARALPELRLSHEKPRRRPSPASPGTADGGGPTVSDAVLDLRRRLREFMVPDPGVEALSVPEALAKLQEHWQTLPHETGAVPPAEFVLDDGAVRQLESAESPPTVSLPVPHVSLLTNLRLLAAQADLRVEIVKTGVVLSPALPRTHSGSQPASMALSGGTLERFADAGTSGPGRLFQTHHGIEITATLLKNGIKESPPPTADPPEHGQADAPMEVEATVSDDGYTIDLNLDPEVMEFEGFSFINYGTPIQTTGVGPSDLYEPLVLTDSKITQPVFATRRLPDRRRQALSGILGPMGLPDRTGIPPEMAEPFPDPQADNSFETKRAFNRGLEFMRLDQCDEAQKQFEKAQAHGPTNPRFIEQLARAQSRLSELYQIDPGQDHGGRPWTSKLMSFPEGILTAGEDSPSGYSWDDEAGLLSATDHSGRTGRILTEVAAAIQESVRLGASLEFTAATEWLDGKPPGSPAAKSVSPPPATASRPRFSSSRAAASVPATTRLTLRCGLRWKAGGTVAMPAIRSLGFPPQTGNNLHTHIHAAGAGFHVHANLAVPQAPDFASLNSGSAQAAREEVVSTEKFLIPGPQWTRLDYPPAGYGKASEKLSLFVRLSRATVPDE